MSEGVRGTGEPNDDQGQAKASDPPINQVRVRRENTHNAYEVDEPLVVVEPGAQVVFETHDTRSGALLDRPQGAPYELPRPTPGSGNPVTGPVGVRGAKPGDCLEVTIDAIDLGPVGWCGGHAHLDVVRAGVITQPIGRTCRVEDGTVQFGSGIALPVRPMLGCLGTAPAGEPVSTAFAGAHGGNMDQVVVAPGARVFLPVFHPEALLFVGDVHATQGDGELSGVALEIPAEVTLRVDLVPDMPLSWPWVEANDRMIVLTAAETFEEARAEAVENMIRALGVRHGLAPGDAFGLISIAGDLRVGQACALPQLTLRLEMPASLELRPVQ